MEEPNDTQYASERCSSKDLDVYALSKAWNVDNATQPIYIGEQKKKTCAIVL